MKLLPSKDTLKQFLLYHLRWQSGFFVVYPTTNFFLGQGLPLWLSICFSSMAGATVFFFIDRKIFSRNSKKKGKK
jgi:hypothetical protein